MIALDCLKDTDTERLNAQDLCEIVGTLKGMPKYGESVRIVFQQKREIIAAGLVEIDKMSKVYVDKIQMIQMESDREKMKLCSQLKQIRDECSIHEKQSNKLQFHLSEIKSPTLHKLCRDGSMKRIRAYVERIDDIELLGNLIAFRKGKDGYIALHEAAASGKHEVLKYLFDVTGNVGVNCRTQTNGCTPLHLAASNGHEKCVKELLSRGADTSYVDAYGKTPRKIAELRSKRNVMKVLRSEGELFCVYCN